MKREEGTSGLLGLIKDMADAGELVSTNSLFNSPIYCVRKDVILENNSRL